MGKQRRRTTCFRLVAVALAISCGRSTEKVTSERSAGLRVASAAARAATRELSASSPYAVDNSLPGVREPHVRKGSKVTELLVDSTSAYGAQLVVADDVIFLLTDKTAHRISPESTPALQQVPLENGGTAAVTRSGIVYWANGSLWRVPSAGGEARRLAKLEQQPQSLMAAGNDMAWLAMPRRDEFLLQTLKGRSVHTLLSYAGRIETATMDAERVLFVRRDGPLAWRIGSISVRGGAPKYTAPKQGPHPAKLAVAGDIYFYDVGANEVRKLSSDLSNEVTLTQDFVCSPIAVSVRIYCPNMDGMFELARHNGAKLMPLFPSTERITAVAASSHFLVWLADAGPGQLSLRMIRLGLDDEP